MALSLLSITTANIRVTPTFLQQQPSTAKCFTVTPVGLSIKGERFPSTPKQRPELIHVYV